MEKILHILSEILRILAIDTRLSNRKIAAIVGCSHPTVSTIKLKLQSLPYNLEQLKVMADEQLLLLFYPMIVKRKSKLRQPNCEAIVTELSKRPKKHRKNIKAHYKEYRAEEPLTAVSESHFYRLIRDYRRNTKLEFKKEYYPGEYMCVDYAGTTLFTVSANKTKRTFYVFVACLPYSNMMFAYATPSMKTQDWIRGLCEAVKYFGKVTKLIRFDNAKAMVKEPGLMAKVTKQAYDFARYHNCICDPTNVYSPQQNAPAEKAVQFITYQVLVQMRSMQFFTVEELNAYLFAAVDKLNEDIMPSYSMSRKAMFTEECRDMQALPKIPYTPIVKQGMVQIPANCLLSYQSNYYSIPYQWRKTGKPVEYKVRVDNTLEMSIRGKSIVTHQLVEGKNQIVRLNEHLAPNHKGQLRKTKRYYMEWAESIGPKCSELIAMQYSELANDRSEFGSKACLSIQKIAKICEPEYFEKACAYALARNEHSAKQLHLIISSGVLGEENKPVTETLPALLSNVRGAEHYQGRM